MILQSYHLPWTNITVVNESQVLAQLDRAFESLPPAIREAKAVLRERQKILQQATEHANRLVRDAEQEAARLLDETGIVRRAQQDARQLHERARIECDRLRQETLQDVTQMRQQAIAECQDLRADAEDYATALLGKLEHHLGDMLHTVQNGRASLGQPVREVPVPAPQPTRKAS